VLNYNVPMKYNILTLAIAESVTFNQGVG